MFLPIGTDRPLRRPTLATYWLIGACVVIYMVQVLAERFADPNSSGLSGTLFDLYLQFPARTLDGEPAPGPFTYAPWQLITYQFLHAGVMHLLGNMLFLWVFGPPVEDRLGRLGFLAFYLFGGVAAGAAHYVFAGVVPIDTSGSIVAVPPVVGASGSISAVTGAFLVLFPRTRIRLVFFVIVIGVYMIPAWVFIAFAIARDLLFNAAGSLNVAYEAHLGGYFYGGLIALALLWLRLIRREPMYDLFSIGRQAKRRRDFRAAVREGRESPWRDDLSKTSSVRAPEAHPRRRGRKRAEPTTAHAPDTVDPGLPIRSALRAGNHAAAADAYLKLTRDAGPPALARDDQLAIARALHERDDLTNAASAYERFLKRFASDVEAQQVRLLLAFINARSLNDPVRAQQLLDEANAKGLPDDLRAMAGTLDAELG